MEQCQRAFPKLKRPERKIKRLSLHMSVDNTTAIVSAEDDSQHAIWQSYEGNLNKGLDRLRREKENIPRQNLEVYLYPNAQRELRDCLVAVSMASQIDSLTKLLEQDVAAAKTAGELKPTTDGE